MTPRNVLIVDDDADILLVTELALRMDPRWITRCASSVAAARAVMASGWTVDVILADVSMPGGGGLDLMRDVHAADAAQPVPVVLFTASVRRQDIGRFEAAGAAGIIAKPFDPLTLGDELDQILSARNG